MFHKLLIQKAKYKFYNTTYKNNNKRMHTDYLIQKCIQFLYIYQTDKLENHPYIWSYKIHSNIVLTSVQI